MSGAAGMEQLIIRYYRRFPTSFGIYFFPSDYWQWWKEWKYLKSPSRSIIDDGSGGWSNVQAEFYIWRSGEQEDQALMLAERFHGGAWKELIVVRAAGIVTQKLRLFFVIKKYNMALYRYIHWYREKYLVLCYIPNCIGRWARKGSHQDLLLKVLS